MPICFAQSLSTSGTPSQEGFAAGVIQATPATDTPSQGGFEAGVEQTTPITETPSQGGFETSDTQISSSGSTVGHNLAISKAIKEGDALHVIVANNGTIPANLTAWRLTLNNGVSKYIFPNFTLNPNSMVTVHTHKNVDTATDLFGSNFMWNGTRDIELLDNNGMLVSEYTINSS
jgi:hypothetical protein